MKIYTRTGDDGTASLLGAGRASKADAVFEVVGDLDEANAAIGWAAVVAPSDLVPLLVEIQGVLFEIGAEVASLGRDERFLAKAGEDAVVRLEEAIDAWSAETPALTNFILPGGSEASARLHLARTVVRRAERALVRAGETNPVRPVVRRYVNRLSDALFAAARLANLREGCADVLWSQP